MEIIAKASKVMREGLEWDHVDEPGIAMIIDDASALHEDFSTNFQNLAVHWQRLTGLAHAGVPYRVYLWEDLMLEKFPDHRLFYFPNLFEVTGRKLAVLRERVLGRNRVVLWGPGTGITGGAEGASSVTGMGMTLLEESSARRVVVTQFDHPMTSGLQGSVVYGDSLSYGPILLPTGRDEGTIELGSVLTARGVNLPGLAVREMEGDLGKWSSVFSAAVPVPADLLRGMARHAGAHVYSDNGDVILASRHLLAVHTTRAGRHSIPLPRRCRVRDLIGCTDFPEQVDRIDFDAASPDTRFYFLT